jgi:hypothetical protein
MQGSSAIALSQSKQTTDGPLDANAQRAVLFRRIAERSPNHAERELDSLACGIA